MRKGIPSGRAHSGACGRVGVPAPAGTVINRVQDERTIVMTQRPQASSLAEVLDRILDKGIVIDIWARVSVVGIEILTVEARVVAASVDTFLHYAQAISQIEMAAQSDDLEDIQNLELDTPTRPERYQEAPSPTQ